jgi:hypothetical protein
MCSTTDLPLLRPALPHHWHRYIELQNTEVLRQHLTASTYLSGSSEQGYKERRGYYRGRPQSK